MNPIVMIVIAMVLAGLFLASTRADDETFVLTDDQKKLVEENLENLRKDLIAQQDADNNLDKE